ncbi:hypothetical protein KR222_005988 [Zaprionus bogoriensis]|nr:hypothetical protein KR222_005988 [Zaprionus bogoriensis]
MQPATSTLTTQTEISKNMQPQNMILPTNKKSKKYASLVQVQMPLPSSKQPLPQQQQNNVVSQPQFQINKAYNVVSILKTASQQASSQTMPHLGHSRHQAQVQQPQNQSQQQNYANVVNRQPMTPLGVQQASKQQQQHTVICTTGGSIIVNEIYNLNGHRNGTGIIESFRTSDLSKASNSAAYRQLHQKQSEKTSGSHCNDSIIGNLPGITLSPSPLYPVDEKKVLRVNVNYINNRKYDYKNSNVLSNSSFQADQEFVSSGNNTSGSNARSNPQSGGAGIYRGPPTSSTPRGTSGAGANARHVHMPAMFPNVVLQQYPPFSQRQPFQTQHLQYAPQPIQYYPYQYLPSMPQQPPHTRSGVAVNTNVSIGNTMPVQGGPSVPLSGPPGTTPSQLQLLTGSVQPGANTVIGVSGTGNGQVGVPPMVNVMPTNVAPVQQVQVPPSSRRRHQHRLQIIDPATRKNILDDFDKSNSNAETDQLYHETPSSSASSVIVQSDVPPISISQTDVGFPLSSGVVMQSSSENRANVQYKIDQSPAQRQETIVGQTPVVSAMSDAPSVEILPTPPQKVKSKRIPIVSPDESESSKIFTNVEVDDAAAKGTAASIESNKQPVCVAETAHSLPTQSKPQQQQLQQKEDKLQQPQDQKSEPSLQQEKPQKQQQQIHHEYMAQMSVLSQETGVAPAVEKKVVEKNVVATLETTENTSSQSEESQQLAREVLSEVLEETSQTTQDISNSAEFVTSILPKRTPDETDRSVDLMEQELKAEIPKHEQEVAVALTDVVEAPQVEKDKDTDTQSIAPIIDYKDGQWSPSNPDGKRQYNREQLLKLREAKASRVQPEVKNVSILPHPNLMPLFMRNNNKRVQSMVGMIGSGANRSSNDASSNFVGKQVSMSGVQAARSSMKGMIHVNLSLNQDVKLNETENAWRPRQQNKVLDNDGVSGSLAGNSSHEKDELVRRVRGILNKLTPERFDTLVEEIIKLKIDTPEKMDEVIVLVFEKAIDEPNFSVSYARLCHRLISEVKARDERMESGTKSNLQHFRNALIDKTEREFTQNVSQSTAKEKKLQPIVDKIKKSTDPNEKAELEAQLEEEERKIRRRSGGTVRFIGELFKISMLTGKIIYSCIDTLLNPHSEDMLECLCKLLTTVGAKFEQTPVNAKEPSRCYSLEKSISRMQAIASKTDKDCSKVSSRVRFMLQDVIDLRKNKWQSTRNEAPKTMGQIEKEAKNEQLSAQYMNYSGSLSTSSTSGPNVPQSGSGKRDDRRYGDNRSTGYGGSHSQRGGEGGGGRQQTHNGGSGSTNSSVVGGANGGNTSTHSNGNNDDNTWHVQTGKGSRSQAVDTNKLEGLTLQLSQNLDTKKMGGVSQFIWNNNVNRQSSTPTTTPSNSFAALSSLIDKNMSSDRDRDRSGPRNKGSYNKGSMERDRFNDRGIHSRTGSSQDSRENSSSRGVSQHSHQQNRSLINNSTLQKTSHSKYTQQAPPQGRHSNKATSSSGNVGMGLYRANEQPITSASSTTITSANAPPNAVFIEPRDNDLKLFKSVLTDIIDLTAVSKSVTPSVVDCIKRIPEQQRCGLLYYILTDYLHLANVGKQYRRYLANSIAYLVQQNYLSVDHFLLAYKEFSEFANDLIVDIPELWLYVFQFAGPLIVKKLLTVSDLWNKNLRDNSPSSMGKKFLKTYLTYCTREVGPNFTRNMWQKFSMRWSDFMPDSEVIDFIESNKLEYVENESKPPVIEERESADKHVKNVIEHIEHLLKEGSTADCIIDYSNGNIVAADKLFIRGLTQTLSNFAIVYKENSYKLEPEIFQKFCIPVFLRYIDSKEDLQLECLYGVQLLVHNLEHPRGLLSELFGELYDAGVIQTETLCKWRDSKDQSAGKGVAVKSLNPFFNSLFNDEAN